MNGKKGVIIGVVLVYIIVGFFAAQYVAGGAYFVVNKTMPADIAIDTWMRYWEAYGDDPVQRKKLTMAAGIGGILVYLVPLVVVLLATRGQSRSLHGDARWASAREIRKAGLL
ncbi:hypothetical protein [Massilia pseudoviolaceinigra]|uniref:hypothetical protein n=1 Tax=Massilia pseudoviolaceinigra TaxID=3057165 RepID=UPI00279695DA|nr:hypothetical protein [Massilia sp. CCM 9206]MDQ1922673.1 hypothetical protein [Massilia sp. CCM 9206]